MSSYLGSVAGEGLTVIDSSADTFDDYNEAFYSTDHHWNIIGAYQAYEDIVAAMGNEDAIAQPADIVTFDEPVLYGSQDRSGLCASASDSIVDYAFNLPEYNVVIDGSTKDVSSLNKVEELAAGAWTASDPFALWYDMLYHADYAEIIIRRNEPQNGKELVLIGDSYSSCIERLFLSAYDAVYVLDPRHATLDLTSYLRDKPSVTDVLVLDCSITMSGWQSTNALG